jgi:hypothetical protein
MRVEAVSCSVATEVVRGATRSIGASGAYVVCLAATCTIDTWDNRDIGSLPTVVDCTREREDNSEERGEGEREMEKHLELSTVSTMNLEHVPNVPDGERTIVWNVRIPEEQSRGRN